MTSGFKCVFLDEMGHIGPYFRRDHPRYHDSPHFGLAGFIIDDNELLEFCGDIVALKRIFFRDEILRLKVNPARYERKSADTFNAKALMKFPEAKTLGFRFLNKIKKRNGKIFYSGREKIRDKTTVNSMGLYKTVLTEAIIKLDLMFNDMNCNWCLFLDEHSSVEQIMSASEKTMFGDKPTRRLIHPPFLVKSQASQGIQAADWVAGLVGRLWNYRLAKTEFADNEILETYFGNRIQELSVQSRMMQRGQAKHE